MVVPLDNDFNLKAFWKCGFWGAKTSAPAQRSSWSGGLDGMGEAWTGEIRTSHATRILTQQEFFWIHSFFINHVTMSRAITGIMHWGVSGRACHGEHVGNGARGAVPPDYFSPGPVHVCSEWRNSAPVVLTVVDSGTSLMKDNERVWIFRIAHQQYQCTVCQGSRVQPRQVRGEFFEAAWWLEISRNWWLLYWRWMPGWSSLFVAVSHVRVSTSGKTGNEDDY